MKVLSFTLFQLLFYSGTFCSPLQSKKSPLVMIFYKTSYYAQGIIVNPRFVLMSHKYSDVPDFVESGRVKLMTLTKHSHESPIQGVYSYENCIADLCIKLSVLELSVIFSETLYEIATLPQKPVTPGNGTPSKISWILTSGKDSAELQETGAVILEVSSCREKFEKEIENKPIDRFVCVQYDDKCQFLDNYLLVDEMIIGVRPLRKDCDTDKLYVNLSFFGNMIVNFTAVAFQQSDYAK